MQISFSSQLAVCVICMCIGLLLGGNFALNKLCPHPTYSKQIATTNNTNQQPKTQPAPVSKEIQIAEFIDMPLQSWSLVSSADIPKIITFVTGNPAYINEISKCVSSAANGTTENATNLQNTSIKDVIMSCNQAAQKADDEAHPYMEARDLAEKLEANVVAFKKDFASKTLKVQGVIYDIDEDLFGHAYVHLYKSMYGVRCFVNDRTTLIELQKGQHIKVQGSYKGDSGTNWYIDLYNCKIMK